MRIAITGAGGALGRAFLAVIPAEHEVHAFARRDLDVRDHAEVANRLVPLEANVIVHLAAMTSVDGCEAEPQRAAETNVLGSFNVAAAARRSGARGHPGARREGDRARSRARCPYAARRSRRGARRARAPPARSATSRVAGPRGARRVRGSPRPGAA